jgi:hypothetical protein
MCNFKWVEKTREIHMNITNNHVTSYEMIKNIPHICKDHYASYRKKNQQTGVVPSSNWKKSSRLSFSHALILKFWFRSLCSCVRKSYAGFVLNIGTLIKVAT